jgi:hypothetical protein
MLTNQLKTTALFLPTFRKERSPNIMMAATEYIGMPLFVHLAKILGAFPEIAITEYQYLRSSES